MEKILLILVFLIVSAIPTFTNLATMSPELSISSAEAQVACQGWWDENCCRWFRPELCAPPPITQEDKDHAQWAARYYENAMMWSTAAGAAYCISAVGAPPAAVPCAGFGAIAAASMILQIYNNRIYNDPFDENYAEPYDNPGWTSYDDLYLGWTLGYSPNINGLAEAAWNADRLGDEIAVGIDRYNSCYEMTHGCGAWQAERVNYRMIWFGQTFQAMASNVWGLADEMEYYGVDAASVARLRDWAGTTYWLGGEYQNR